MKKPSPRLALSALILGACAIGFSPIFVRLSPLGPVSTAFYRVALALPLLALWAFLESRRNHEKMHIPLNRPLIVAGLFFVGDLVLWHLSLQFTNVANSTLFANFAPIFVVIGAWVLWRDRPTSTFTIGLILSLTGAVLVVGVSFEAGLQQVWGDALAIATAVFYGGYILSVKVARGQFRTANVMLVSSLVTTIVLLPVAWLVEGRLWHEEWQGWGILILLAWFSHTAGQGLIAFALAHLAAGFSSVSLLVQPMVAGLLAWIILGESLSVTQALGGLVLLAGIYICRRGSS